ncbi:MAG: hypothetical protein R2728_16100 [Chitinophagales bacterium]
MKNIISTSLVLALVIIVQSCVELPDLYPSNSAGPAMDVVSINDTIYSTDLFSAENFVYDLDNNNQPDVQFIYQQSGPNPFTGAYDIFIYEPNLQVLVSTITEITPPTPLDFRIYPLKEGDLIGNSNLIIGADWNNDGHLDIDGSSGTCFQSTLPREKDIYAGIRFVNNNNQYYLGWVKLFIHFDQADPCNESFLVIKSIAYSTTPNGSLRING